MINIMMNQLTKEEELQQVSYKEGVKRFGKKAIYAMLKEYTQMGENDKRVFIPQHANKLTRQQKRKAMRIISLIKQKRDNSIKGRMVADGRKQRIYTCKDEFASPTAQLESLIMTWVIDALENRDTATADVGGAFLLSDITDFVLIKLDGEVVDIICEANPSYTEYVTNENNKKVLYMKLRKSLYGIMQAAILWYETFSGCLRQNGFTLNPYDPCVANKMIEGKQCTIVWHVDDNKISHKDPKVVDKVIQMIEDEFGNMTVKRGKKHTFVGMNFDMKKNGTIGISMKDYIKESIDSYKEEIKEKVPTPARKDLFDIDTTSEKLEDERMEIFHHIVAKILYVSKRARPDISTTIAFLCTRVDRSTE